MARIPLEDNFTDILDKAQRGLQLNDTRLASRARVSVAQLTAAKSGHTDDAVIRNLATALNLGPNRLVASARQKWHPADPGPIDGLACFNTPFSDMTVNSYLAFDLQTRIAAAFDTGTDCDPLLKLVRERGLKIELILLTHTHGDHVYELDRLKEATSAPAYVSERETLSGATPFADGRVFELVERASRPFTGQSGTGVSPVAGEAERAGRPFHGLTIETRRTSGHARGGTTFVVTGLARRLAVVGDALFAGSMGGGQANYAEALRTNRENIFTLPDDTVLCPGHGPLTTVGEEKAHNPFYPEFQKE
jgi:glyoxylase-like metal-dependent hydrolase (beta-lactamase superfamily II)